MIPSKFQQENYHLNFWAWHKTTNLVYKICLHLWYKASCHLIMLHRHSTFPWRVFSHWTPTHLPIPRLFFKHFVFWYPCPLQFPVVLLGVGVDVFCNHTMLYSRQIQIAAGCSTSMPKVPMEITIKIAPKIACINDWIRLSCVTLNSCIKTFQITLENLSLVYLVSLSSTTDSIRTFSVKTCTVPH